MRLAFNNVAGLCKNISLEDEKPVIDLSNVKFFRPYALVYLGMFLRYHNSKGKNFQIVAPNHTSARDYLAKQNFWERFNFDPATIKRESLRRFTNSTSFNDITDVEKRSGIAEDIANQIRGVIIRNKVNINSALITELICELIDNFAIHSRSMLAVVTMQYYPNLHRLVCAVGDCGIGIRESLSSNPDYSHLKNSPHHEAALKAFEPLVSRLSSGGTGLTEVRDEVFNLNGRLTMSTGDGYVRMSNEGVICGNMVYNLPGVQMELSFPEG